MQNSANFPKLPILVVLTVLTALAGFAARATAGLYLDSGHGGSQSDPGHYAGQGVLRSSLAGKFAAGNCAHCHEQHASVGGSEPAPASVPSRYLLLDNLALNAACDHCHDTSGQNGADDIASQIGKNSRHDPNSFKVSTGQQPQCNICHDSHVATKVTHREAVDGNLINGNGMGPLLDVAGVQVAAWPLPGTPPAGGDGGLASSVPTFSALDPITMEWQLCLSCHGGQSGFTLTNLSGQFNPNNFSVHPVASPVGATAWQNTWLWNNYATAFNAPWNTLANRDKPMYCSDCHGSETGTDPVGPHGSNNNLILKLAGPGTGVCPDNTTPCSTDSLCLKCHVNPATNSSWADTPAIPYPLPNTALVGDHTLAAHQWPANPMGCLACHGGLNYPNPITASNVHGANFSGMNNGPNTWSRPSYAFMVSPLIARNYYQPIPVGPPPPTSRATEVVGQRRCATVLWNGIGCHVGDGGAGYWW